ncbi:HpcH/HpaI aldolase/citrate lyase family protein [Mesorhizobium marinum]|uniref:HpcH/HpaI aldolase/citrate lyase family protein n=1 Tax=Mesorhizobium marinum TaxID=3228790 RepID=UPI0034653595
MRSLLFVPGDSESKLEKGFAAGADVVIVDLEDSVAPANKPLARQLAPDAIRTAGGSCRVFVRVNDLGTGHTDEDLAAVVPARPDGIILPKAQGGADVQHLASKLRVAEIEAGLPDGGIGVIPIVTETGLATLSTASYANSSPRLKGLTWGAEDLSAAVGARSTRDDQGRYTDVFRFARTVTLLAASACDVAAIDTVYVDFRDLDGLRSECLEAERDGFTGKLAVHPAQVAVINEVFTPSAEAVGHARNVISAFAAAGNPGVVAIDGKMYDIPHLKRAERLLARANVTA